MQIKQRIYFIFSILILLFTLLLPSAEAQGFAGNGLADGVPNLSTTEQQSLQADPGKLRSQQGTVSSSDRYIVVMKTDITGSQRQQAIQNAVAASGGRINAIYQAAINGFSATLPPEALDQWLADPDVDFIEPDSIVSISDSWVRPDLVEAFGSQTDPVWGLDRIDQRDLPLDGTFIYDTKAGDVHAYVVDTGIRTTHDEFSGRVGNGYSAFDDGDVSDCNGHGTHVAGTIGGTTYGVAKGVTIHPVRVMDCEGNGDVTDLIAGLDWIITHGSQPGVVNLSLGAPANDSLDLAVNNTIDAGFSVVAAAGNNDDDACLASPARVEDAITVGATDSSDNRASFSNYGTCLDVFAPGVSIKSAYIRSNSDYVTMSGTSMAAPHVAGAAALYLHDNPAATPQTVAQHISDLSTKGKIIDPGTDSPNQLLFVNSGPIPLSPKNTVLGGSPTFEWMRVEDATQYELELYEGSSTAPVETRTYDDKVCIETKCSVVPEFSLNYAVGQYRWRMQASAGKQLGDWTDALEFTYVDPINVYLPVILID